MVYGTNMDSAGASMQADASQMAQGADMSTQAGQTMQLADTDASMFTKMKEFFTGGSKEVTKAAEELNPFAQPTNNQRQSAGNQNGQQSRQSSSQNGQPANNEAFDSYVAKMNFTEKLDMSDPELFSDPSKLTSMINNVAQQAYGKAMQDTSKVMEKYIQRRFSDYDSKLDGRMNNVAKNHMTNEKAQKELSLMQDSSTAPLAQAVMKGFLNQGYEENKAIALTKQYFQNIGTKMSGSSEENARAAKSNRLDALFDF